MYSDKLYTLVCFSLTSLSLFLFYLFIIQFGLVLSLERFLVSLIPFLLVNGFLTGSFTENPIVRYNSNHIIGFRIINIPVEDSMYCLLVLLMIVIATYENTKK